MASIVKQIEYLYGQVRCLSAQIELCCGQTFDFVPYTGANKTVDLNTQHLLVGDIIANSFIKVGGFATEYLMADGSTTIGGGGGATDLSYIPSPTNGIVNSSTGTGATILLADATNAGLITPAEKIKIADSITGFTETDPLSVHLTGAQTVAGVKTFADTLVIDSDLGSALAFKRGTTVDATMFANSVFFELVTRNLGGVIFKNGLTGLNLLYIQPAGETSFINSVTATSFVKSGGLVTEFLKADGSVDSNTYLTSVPSLLQVTAIGGYTTNAIVIETIDNNGLMGTSTNGVGVYGSSPNGVGIFANSSASVAFLANISSENINNIANFSKNNVTQAYVTHNGKYTGSAFVKIGGLVSQFLKADGSTDSSAYLTSFTETDPLSIHLTGNQTAAGIKTFSDTPNFASSIIKINNSDNDGYGSISLNFNRYIFQNKTGNIQAIIQDTGLALYKSSTILANIFTANLTVTRSFYLPNKGGIFALTSDLVGRYLDEGNGVGMVFWDFSRTFYGNIGLDAIDFSYSDVVSSTYGATGESSFAAGVYNTASGNTSTVFGYANIAGGIGDFVAGFNNQSIGYTNYLTGIGHRVTGTNATVVGQAADIITNTTLDFNIGNDIVFAVGNGTIVNADPDYNVLTRSTALLVRKNGAVEIKENLLVNKNITGLAFIKAGGLGTQYLMADGTTSLGSGLSLTTVEVSIGTVPKRSGKFSITTTELTPGKNVIVTQAVGPYTGKGTLADETEMDILTITGKTTSGTNIDCYWNCATFVKGNYKFNYAISA